MGSIMTTEGKGKLSWDQYPLSDVLWKACCKTRYVHSTGTTVVQFQGFTPLLIAISTLNLQVSLFSESFPELTLIFCFYDKTLVLVFSGCDPHLTCA